MLSPIFPLLALLALSLASPACNDNISLALSVSALNLDLPSTPNLSSLTISDAAYFNSLTTTSARISVNGTYTISGRYCEPEVYNASRRDVVQLLVHGGSYDREYWSGIGLGEVYLWEDYGSKEGFPTFTVDRLCNGRSTYLPGLTCQLSLNAALLDVVISSLRNGAVGNRSFNKVIWVGHSIGSLTANVHAHNYPNSIDSYVLTGFTSSLVDGEVGALVNLGLSPAAVVFPEKYGSLDPTYVVYTDRRGFEEDFYFGSYEEAVVNADFARHGVVPTGEAATATLGQLPALDYTGPILVLTGQDAIFCGKLLGGGAIGIFGDSGSGNTSLAAQTRSLYSKSRSYQWALVPESGHDLNLHDTAQETFRIAHDFLLAEGY